MLRVRTGPECPEDNLRELTGATNPNCGIAREREKEKKKKKREDFLAKGSNLRRKLAHSQNKGLTKHQSTASRLWTGPSPHQRQRGRQAAARARRQGAILTPETGILHQTVSSFAVANHVFLEFLTADIC